MAMYNPAHPGEVIREFCVEPLGLTVTETAQALGVARKTLSELLNGHSSVSPEMAIRLSIAFDTSADSWLIEQAQYDLWKEKNKHKKFNIKNLVDRKAA